MENNIDDIQIGDKTLKQWEEEMNAPSPATTATFKDAEEMGLINPEEAKEGDNKLYNTLDTLGIEHPAEDKEYEKLGAWDTTKDVAKSLGVEASHIFAPKDRELQYESRTHFGENVKYGYRYLAGTAGFIFGGEAIAGAKVLANLGKAGKTIQGIGKLLSANKLIKTGTNATKAAKVGAAVANASLGGAAAGALADFTLYRPEENEGHLADVFRETDNALISYMQSKGNDTDLDSKLKNVVEGFVMGIGVGNLVEFGAKPLFKKAIKNLKALKEGKKGAAEAVIQDQINVERFTSKADLLEQVENIKAEADASGQEASQLLIDRLHPSDNTEAQQMLKVLEDGDEIFMHSDGTWDISVNKWDDAYKVSPEEYKRQLLERDEAMDGYTGDSAISHQDEAVRHTWINRGWLGEAEDLTKPNANKIAKNYKDKWQIDNNIKVEFVDGLTINGKAVEGNTTSTKYQGKSVKSKQNAIDKKKLQISQLEDKITMAEGDNAEVKTPLDNLKEELRIAKNELKALEKESQGKNKIPDITVQIDTNARNPYAALRAELEHARDIAKGEVPNQSERHFSRYEGMNEGEVASNYVYKKAQGKNKALQNVMDAGQNAENGVKYNQETINESTRYETINEQTSGDGSNRGIPSTNDEGIRPYTRRSNDGSKSGLVVHEASPEFRAKYEAQGYKVNNYKELAVNSDESAASFIANFRAANEINGKNAAQVYEYSPEEYKQMRLFTAENGKSGFAIKPDGDMVSVFSSERGAAHAMVDLAIQNGATKLDCFDTFLTKLYKKHGFVEVDRVKWNEEYKPANWDKEYFKQYNNGEPDVVYMKLKQTPPAPTEPRQLKLDFTQTIETKQSTGDIVTGIVNGDVKPQTRADIETIISKVEQLNPEISGFKWKDLEKDSKGYAKKLEEIFDDEDVSGLIEALSKGDIDNFSNLIKVHEER